MSPRPIRVDEVTDIWSFLATIDWEERWLWALGGFHLLCVLLTIITRKTQTLQAVFFLLFLAIVFFSEYINELAAKNWQLFAEQQYFDSHGLFISILLSTPLLLNCSLIALMWMWSAWNLMITVKRSQLRHQASVQKAENEKKDK